MYKKVLGFVFIVLGIFALTSTTSAASLGSVSFRFCDDTDGKIYLANQKTIAVTPGEDNEVCINFNNGSEEQVKVLYGFSYGFMNEGGTQVCDQDSTRNNKFSKFFVQSGDSTLVLAPKEQKTLKIQIKVPLGLKGMQYGCFVNTVEGSSAERGAGQMFAVVVRKIFPLNLFIGKQGDIKSSLTFKDMKGSLYSTNSKIKADIKNGSNLDISAHIKNEGNVTQIVEISGTINNFFGFEKIFTTQEIKLIPGEEKDFLANVGVIPGYKGFFTVNMNVKGTPFFDFDVSGLDETVKNGIILSQSATIYAFSWISIIAILAVILILLMIIKPRKKHVKVA